MKKILLIAVIIFTAACTSHAQNNCDSLIHTYGSGHASSKMFVTNDGNYLFAGRLMYKPPYYNLDTVFYLQKTDGCGNQIWRRLFVTNTTGYRSYNVSAFDVSATGDVFAVINADSLFANWVYHQIRLVKVNAEGQRQWISGYADSISDIVPYVVCATTDGGALVGGWRGSIIATPPQQSILIKFSNTGKVEWVKYYGGGLISSIRQTKGDGYVFMRVKWSKPQTHTYLHKTNSKGTLLWSTETPPYNKNKYYDPYSNGSVYVLPQPDSGYTVVRTTNPGYFPDLVYLSKYNNSGAELWSKTYSYLSYQLINSIQNAKDGGYLLGGFYNERDTSGIYLMRLNKTGDTVFTKKVTHSHIDYIDSTTDIYTSGADAYETANNKYVIGGTQQTNIPNAPRNYYASLLIKFVVSNNAATFADAKVYQKQPEQTLHIFPNPVAAMCTIQIPVLNNQHAQLQLIDLYGKTLKTVNLKALQKSIQLDVHSIAAGMYKVNIIADNKLIASSKLIIIH